MQLSLEDERRVRLARLCQAMGGEQPPGLPNPAFHLYSDEHLFAVRPARRLEYFGPDASAAPACYAGFGRPLFRAGGFGGQVYMAAPRQQEPPAISPEWREVGSGRMHLTSWRVTFQGDDGDWLDLPFDAITWADCYADGIGICAANWSPMYFQSPYPEWLYAFFRFVAHHEVPQVPLAAELDQRAHQLGL